MKGDALLWSLCLAWGAFLGTFYFLGLWWTVKRIPGRTRPRLWLGVSYAVRTVCLLAGLWLVLRKDVTGFLAALLGFFLMRYIIMRKVGLEKSGGGCARQSG